ncbi:MAG: penicillin-binding protein activator [Candidatus Latescibacterota bacterium]|nr:MAG: penicillin-binding protein activator [Candidatus Latescibacterota bacterium]
MRRRSSMNERVLSSLSANALAVFVICVLGFGGCTIAPRTDGAGKPRSYDSAESLYNQAKSDFDLGDFEASERNAVELLRAYPDFPKTDEVLYIAVKSSHALMSFTETVRYAQRLSDDFPLSPYRDEALLLAADAYGQLGQPYNSADMLSRLLASPIDAELRETCLASLLELTQDKLGVGDLERLVKEYPSSPLAAEMSLGLAKKEFARANYDRAYSLLADLLYEFPQHARSREIRYLLQLSAQRREDPNIKIEYVEPNKLGVVLPYTGDYSRFGRYFEEGVRLAVEEFNASRETPVSFVLADSKADPVDAVNAVRKLVLEEGVVAVLGSVFTVPSIAAATECNARRAPMLSPVVPEQRIGEIGPWVFQINIPLEVEVSAVARVAVENLLLRRFAVLSPSTPESRGLTGLFIKEVQRRGGRVVAEQYYGSGDTDFKEQLDAIRESAPEALFIPGEPVELMQILPQVRFYDLQLQLLGLSNWNSEKLLRLSAPELEGALFPREGYRGKTPEAYERFVDRYTKKYGRESSQGSGIDEVHPVAVSGYFGMRVLLGAVESGAVDREQVREFLDTELNTGAESRMAEANSLPMVRVRSGKISEFTAHRRSR